MSKNVVHTQTLQMLQNSTLYKMLHDLDIIVVFLEFL